MKSGLKHAARYFARRLAWALFVVVGVGTVSFFMARKLPGDPARMLVGPQASAQDVERARRIYGLDQGLWGQYRTFWRRLVHIGGDDDPEEDHATCAGETVHIDLGYSYRYRAPVTTLIAKRAPRSFELALAAMLFQLLIGLGVGIVSATKRGSVWDQMSIGATLIAISAPTFVLGLVLQYVFAHRLGWLPFDGYSEEQWLRSLVLPALTLGMFGAAIYARLTRDELGRALDSDYVRAARAKGASGVRVVVVHALRNAMVPIVTLMVLDFGALIGGAIVTEKLFRWPGMGAMAVDAMVHRDGPVIFGTVLLSAAAIVLASLALDVVYVLLDPKLRRDA